jgi:hypothetical protein
MDDVNEEAASQEKEENNYVDEQSSTALPDFSAPVDPYRTQAVFVSALN